MAELALPVRWLGEFDMLNAQDGETHFLNFLADALREAARADVSFIFASDLRGREYGKFQPGAQGKYG